MNIVFMGTPDFASASLTALLEAEYRVSAVFTKADKPRGRGLKLTPSPVKEIAITNGIPCYQPDTLKDDEMYETLAALKPDLIVVVAYGLFLPKRYLDLPPLGCINLHGSLLPKYRGAAPIQWAVIRGEARAGVCTMYMVSKMDAGDVILSKSVDVSENDTSGMVYDSLKVAGAALLLETIPLLEAGTAPRTPQVQDEATFAPPLHREDVRIDWTRSAQELHNLIRGAQPAPCATSGDFKLHESRLTVQKADAPPGTVVAADEQGLLVCCGDGALLRITKLQIPGKPKMEATAYVRGHGLPVF